MIKMRIILTCIAFLAKVLYYNKTLWNLLTIKMPNPKPHPPNSQNTTPPVLRAVFFVLGFVFVGLGILGAFLPVLPTTVFILLAGYCWARSSERFYHWLANHKVFGKMLKDWEERRAMPRFAKYLAWAMMGLSCAFLFWRLPADKLWVAIVATTICVASAVWIARLPDAWFLNLYKKGDVFRPFVLKTWYQPNQQLAQSLLRYTPIKTPHRTPV